MTPKNFFSPLFTLTLTIRTLILISALAFILRFYALATNPPALNLDEVAIGYNAYSILHTGRDEYGQLFPVAFRSHDDYKAPLYIYLTTIPIKLFGLNAFGVRFVSALAGSLSIPVFFYLVKELFSKDKYKYLYSLIASLLLTISPWHLQFSRAAFETNLATFLVLLGVLLYLLGKSRPLLWFISAVSFVASLYAYHSTKLFIPLMLIVLFIDAQAIVKKHTRLVFIIGLWSLLLTLPLFRFMTTPESRLRYKGTSVFETPTLVDANRQQKIWQWREGRVWEAFVFHNDALAGTFTILKGYFSHLTFHFLFLGENGPPRNFTPNVGLLYLWELPFIVVGLHRLYRHTSTPKLMLFSWFLIAPLASSFTWDAPSSTRTMLLVPPLTIFSALGIGSLITSQIGKKTAVKVGLIVVMIFFFAHYLHNYYRIAPTVYADMWQYGYQEAVEFSQSQLDSYDQVIVSTNLKQPQNFFAFYLSYDPATYIEVDGGTVSGGFNETKNHFGKYVFTPISWNQNDLQDNYLYIDLEDKVPPEFKPIHAIKLPDGRPNLVVVKKNPRLEELYPK